MNPLDDYRCQATRRTFLGATAGAVGQAALGTLLAGKGVRNLFALLPQEDALTGHVPHVI